VKQTLLAFVAIASCVLFVGSALAQDYFTVGQEDGRWWLFDTEGERFFSTGVNALTPQGHHCPDCGGYPYHDTIMEKYGSEEAWAEATVVRLDDWKFNTLGGWCNNGLFPEMPYAPVLYLSGADWLSGYVPDYWSDEFYDHVEEASQTCYASADDTNLLGYFIDNEMRWGPDWRRFADLFADYVELEPYAPGKVVLQKWLMARYQSNLPAFTRNYGFDILQWDDFQQVQAVNPLPNSDAQAGDRVSWTAFVADHFFEVTTNAIREKDPNHLILGARFVSWLTPAAVVDASAQYIDVMSINHYQVWPLWRQFDYAVAEGWGFIPTEDMLARFYERTGLPILISEFAFRGLDALPPSTWPPQFLFQTAADQAERTLWTQEYITECIESEYCLGYHWFDWVDEPEEGRFDGENSNFGLVSEADEEYELLVNMFSEYNDLVYQWPFK
jgi:hypothetical protein